MTATTPVGGQHLVTLGFIGSLELRPPRTESFQVLTGLFAQQCEIVSGPEALVVHQYIGTFPAW